MAQKLPRRKYLVCNECKKPAIGGEKIWWGLGTKFEQKYYKLWCLDHRRRRCNITLQADWVVNLRKTNDI